MEQSLARQIRILQIYAGILTIALLVLAVLYWHQATATPHFKQIDAERINIIENDGKLRMVISNSKLQHPGMIGGKSFPPRDRDAGMIFFNEDGDECGGMGYNGTKNGAGMYYSFDQYKNDQLMQLQYLQDTPNIRSYGLKLWDRPDSFSLAYIFHTLDSLKRLNDTALFEKTTLQMANEGKFGRERLFVGKTRTKDVGLFLRDSKGIIRLRIGIDSLDHIFFDTFDDKGNPEPRK